MDVIHAPLWLTDLLYRCLPVLQARERLSNDVANLLPHIKSHDRREHLHELGRSANFIYIEPDPTPSPNQPPDPERAREWFLAQGIMVD